MTIPPTRNHRQLAAWINEQKLVDKGGRAVRATVQPRRISTDRKAGRLRIPGKGRASLRLTIELVEEPAPTGDWYADRFLAILFTHDSGEVFARHEDARRWVSENLREVP